MDGVKLAPIDRSARIQSLDVLRGVAALGILLMNIPLMGLRWDWARPPLPATPSLDWIAFSLQDVGAAGTMRGLFTLLFGAGMLVMLNRPDPAREAAVGRMALTTYIGQSVITSLLFYGLGFYDRFGFAQLMGIVALIWIVQIAFALVWLGRFEMGPAEWALRWLTYGQRRALAKPGRGVVSIAAE